MPPEYGHLNRHYNFGKKLALSGYEPYVFVGSYLHNVNKQLITDKSLYKKYEKCDYPYYFIKTCAYSTSKFKRVYAMFEFYRNLFKATRDIEKPDVIVGSSPHPLATIAAIKLAKTYGCPSIVEVRDLWPESIVAYGLLKKNSIITKILYHGEKWIYKKADKLIFTMEGGKDYITGQGWDKGNGGPIDISKVYHINNGVDLDQFIYNQKQYVIHDKDLDDEGVFKVVYTGSVRKTNNVRKIIETAKFIERKGINNIRFLIYGDGSEREDLEKYCFENRIHNVRFKGFVDKKYIPYILSKSDLNIMHFQQNSLKKYGASLNKMFEYFASGKPIVSDCEFGYDLVKRYKCGIVVDNADVEQLANAIFEFSNMLEDEYNEYCENAKIAAKEYDFKVLTEKLVDLF